MNVKSISLLLGILVAFSLNTLGQNTPQTVDTAQQLNIWLINSNKTVIKQNGSTVDRAFFTADKVYIGSNPQAFKKEDGYSIIIYGAKGTVALGELGALLSEATKKKILKEPAGTRIVFGRGSGKSLSTISIILQ